VVIDPYELRRFLHIIVGCDAHIAPKRFQINRSFFFIPSVVKEFKSDETSLPQSAPLTAPPEEEPTLHENFCRHFNSLPLEGKVGGGLRRSDEVAIFHLIT